MAYSVPNLNPSSATYPHVGGVASSAVERKNLRAAAVADTVAAENLKTNYTEIFNKHAKVQDNLLKQLNAIFGKNIPMDGNRHVEFTKFIKDVCVDSDQANDAYKFYGRQIIEQINQLGDYILKARALLNQATADMPQWLIDQLDILDGFSKEMNDTFGSRYMYDLNEDIWKLYEDDYADATHTQFNDKDDAYKPYDKLRTMKVEAYKKQEYQKDPAFDKKTIEVFNELNLLDRLKYIKLYYDVDSGKTDSVFPNDKSNGIPIVKEASRTDVVAAIEPFFMGYLIDRDGPVNAVASYLEVKSAALIEKIRLESEKIKALNVYLKFIQRALDVLNSSQTGADGDATKHRLPDGGVIGLTYLCGGNMYELAEAVDGTKCLVLEDCGNQGQYLLISADDAGMNCLLGDRGDIPEWGNGYAGTALDGETGLHYIRNINFSSALEYWHYSTKTSDGCYNDVQEAFGKPFEPTPVIDCEKINPKSVRRYAAFANPDEITTETVQAWQKAFQDKISFIQTSIDTINTDMKVFRDKIDTLNTLSNTFRNRTYNAYAKVTSNIKK